MHRSRVPARMGDVSPVILPWTDRSPVIDTDYSIMTKADLHIICRLPFKVVLEPPLKVTLHHATAV